MPNPGSAGTVFGERNWLNPGSTGLEFGEKTELNHNLAGSELGEKNGPNPGLVGSEFGEKKGPNPGSAGLEKRMCPTLVPRFGVRRYRSEPWFRVWVWSSKKRTVVWQVLSLEKKPGQTFFQSLGLEFGERTGPNPGLAGSEFGERNWSNLSWAGSMFGARLWPNTDLGFGFGERKRLNPSSAVQRSENGSAGLEFREKTLVWVRVKGVRVRVLGCSSYGVRV